MNASRLDAWLKRTPPSATRLLLEWDSLDGVQPVYEWSRAEIAQDLSAPILFAIQDHCDDLRAKASYRVSWRDDAGKVLATKTCNAEPESELAASFPTPVGSVTTEAATQAGLTAQLMRHVETRERMHNGAMGAVLKSLHDRIAEQATELRELRAENSLLRKRMRAAEDSEGAEEIEALARANAWQKVGDAVTAALPSVLERFARAGAGAPETGGNPQTGEH